VKPISQIEKWESYDFTKISEQLSEVSNMRNVSISVKNEIILEQYFNMCESTSKNNVFSVTKSVTSLLVGIAIEEGYLEGVDQKVSDIIDMNSYDVPESFYDITIENLLTMSSGIAWDGSIHTTEFLSLKHSKNPLEHIFAKEATFIPGERFNYSDATAHLMAEVLFYATDKTPFEYASEKLFEPLGIIDARWTETSSGVNLGVCDLMLISNDMQLVPESWIDISTTAKMGTGSSSGYNKSYGYYYWIGETSGVPVISGIGHGGQFIVIVPDYDIVVTASTIGGVSDEKANAQIREVARIIYYALLPDMFNEID